MSNTEDQEKILPPSQPLGEYNHNLSQPLLGEAIGNPTPASAITPNPENREDNHEPVVFINDTLDDNCQQEDIGTDRSHQFSNTDLLH